MKQLLILFTNGFPYSISEPFLEKEYPLYRDYFDKVLIVAACKRGEQPTRQIDASCTEVLPDYTLSKDVWSILAAIPWTLSDPMLWKEIRGLYKRKMLSWRRLYDLLATSLCGNHMAMQAARWQRGHSAYPAAVIYSYWLRIPGYAAVRLKRKCPYSCASISRAHGFDVYLDRHADGYIPFHHQIYQGLDMVAPVSEDGKRYLQAQYGAVNHVQVHRLGVANCGYPGPTAQRQPLRLVSCSRVVPLKRLERIVDALCLIQDQQVIWTHLGGGAALEALKTYACKNLPSNIQADFRGTLPNSEVYKTYQTEPFHLFLNVSETEGVPVSIMEAMGFGIPAAATAVGGTPDLVMDGKNGYLLPKNFHDEELAAMIVNIASMPAPQYNRMRNAAREKIIQDYSAETNYRCFLDACIRLRKEGAGGNDNDFYTCIQPCAHIAQGF